MVKVGFGDLNATRLCGMADLLMLFPNGDVALGDSKHLFTMDFAIRKQLLHFTEIQQSNFI